MEYDVSKMMFFKANPTGEREFSYDFMSDDEKLDVANQITKGKIDAYIKVLNHLKESFNNMDVRNDGYATVNSLKGFILNDVFARNLHSNGFTLIAYSYKCYTGISISGGVDIHNNFSSIHADWYSLKHISIEDKIKEAFICAVDIEKEYYINNDPYGKALNELTTKASQLVPYDKHWSLMSIGECIKNNIHPSLEEINDRIAKLDKAIKTSDELKKQEKASWDKYWDARSVLQSKINELERQLDNLEKENDNERKGIRERGDSVWKGGKPAYDILLKPED